MEVEFVEIGILREEERNRKNSLTAATQIVYLFSGYLHYMASISQRLIFHSFDFFGFEFCTFVHIKNNLIKYFYSI